MIVKLTLLSFILSLAIGLASASALAPQADPNPATTLCTCGIRTGLFCGARATAASGSFLRGNCVPKGLFDCNEGNVEGGEAVLEAMCDQFCLNDVPGRDHCLGNIGGLEG